MDSHDPHPAPWRVDLEWLWGTDPEGPVATLRLRVDHDDAAVASAAVARFLDDLPADDQGMRGRGGWAAIPRPELAGATSRVLDLVSGGEDVADGLQEAAEAAFESLSTTPAIRLQWEQLPLASTGQQGELTESDVSLPVAVPVVDSLFDMPQLEPRVPRPSPHRGRNRETWRRRVTVEVTILDAAAVARGAKEAERNTVDLGPVPDGEAVGPAPEEAPGSPVDTIAGLIWATDGQHDLMEAGAFRIMEITSEVADKSSNRGVITWSSTVKLTHVERLRELASRTHPADGALIADDLEVAWNHAADPYAPIRWVPGIAWRPLTVAVEHLPARPRRFRSDRG